MLVQYIECSWRLIYRDEFLCSLFDVSWSCFGVFERFCKPTLSTFSGFVCGGGGILTVISQ